MKYIVIDVYAWAQSCLYLCIVMKVNKWTIYLRVSCTTLVRHKVSMVLTRYFCALKHLCYFVFHPLYVAPFLPPTSIVVQRNPYWGLFLYCLMDPETVIRPT